MFLIQSKKYKRKDGSGKDAKFKKAITDVRINFDQFLIVFYFCLVAKTCAHLNVSSDRRNEV